MISDNYLPLYKVNELMPAGKRLSKKVERALYATKTGEPIAIGFSKRHKDGYWYCMTAGYFARKGVKVFCLVAGNDGIFLIPKKTMGEFCKHTSWRERNKGRSYTIRIKKVEDKYLMFVFGGYSIEITETFIPVQQ